MIYLQIAGLIVLVVGLLSVGVGLLYWVMDLDFTFHLFDDE